MEKIKKSKQGVFSIFSISDAIAEDAASEFQKTVSESLEKGEVKIILDLSSVPFISSKGLEILLEMHKESQKRGGGIKIAGPSEICADIFYATHLANSLEIYSDIESARRSFL